MNKANFRVLAAVGMAIAGLGSAGHAQVTITCLTNAGHLTRQHEPLAKMFNEMQDEIVVQYAAPAKDYADTHLRMFRASATNTLPDCAFQAYNQLPSLARALHARGQIVDLGPLLEREGGEWVAANYSDAMLALGQVDGLQFGMPFNASVIQWYYNADLFRQVGRDPDDFPRDWDGIFALAREIDALGDDIYGMAFTADQGGDDWSWQTLIMQQGGLLLDEAQMSVAFHEADRAVNAMHTLRRMVSEGTYDPTIPRGDQQSSFTNGAMGIYASSPAGAKNLAELVGDRFDLRSAPFNMVDEVAGRLPTGGNAVIVTASDPDKIDAVWEYVKFVTGPKAQEITALNTGYLPTNLLSLNEDHLAPFYRENPYYATPSMQYHRAGPWQGYPGTQSEKIWRDQRSVIRAVMLGELSPEDGAAQMRSIAEALMQR